MKILPFGTESPDPVYIKVVEHEDGVLIRVVGRDGKLIPSANLVKITPKGIYKFGFINPLLGFERDSLGRLKEIVE